MAKETDDEDDDARERARDGAVSGGDVGEVHAARRRRPQKTTTTMICMQFSTFHRRMSLSRKRISNGVQSVGNAPGQKQETERDGGV